MGIYLTLQTDLTFLLPEATLQRLTRLVHLAARFTPNYKSDAPLILEIPLIRTTPYLTYLDLSKSNTGSIPNAIMGLESLQYLKISKCPLQLRQQCLAILISLSKLRTLEMKKKKWYQGSHRPPDSPFYSWDAESREMMNTIEGKLPGLDMQIGPAQRGREV